MDIEACNPGMTISFALETVLKCFVISSNKKYVKLEKFKIALLTSNVEIIKTCRDELLPRNEYIIQKVHLYR